MAALSLLPIWVFMYVRVGHRRRRRSATGPLGVGAEVYSTCASPATAPPARAASAGRSPTARCSQTFPHIEDQLRFVYFGTAEYNLAGVEIYGNPDREGGPHLAGSFGVMPAAGLDRRRRA